MRMTGAEMLMESLKREGVDTIFGYPGGAVLYIYDALARSSIRHVLVRHEQAAAHAADGYARATGKVGVCLATSGPGATNLVTGIATAHMDSVPLVAITGQVNTSLLGRDSFQEADITGITMPITKHSFLVKETRQIGPVVREAFHIARSGRPGVVVVDLPKDVTAREDDFSYPPAVSLGQKEGTGDDQIDWEDIQRRIINAERPVICAGGGIVISGAEEQLRKFAETLRVPVTTTLMGLSAFPADHPLSLGMLGMHGTRYANYAIMEADLLVAIGVRFDDRVTGNIESFAPNATIIHIDVDPAEIGKNVSPGLAVVQDAGEALSRLMKGLPRAGKEARNGWLGEIKSWKESNPLKYKDSDEVIKPQKVVEEISRITGGEAVVSTDVGQHQMWVAHYYCFHRSRSFLTSGGLGTMGYGLPAAIGAQFGRPESTVVAVLGDGGFQMNSQELATVALYQLPIKICLLNNGFLGMVRQWQELFFEGRYSAVDMGGNPDFVRLAEAYGLTARRVTAAREVTSALEWAFEERGPVLVEFAVDPLENVYPMVPAGGTLREMIG